MSGFWLSISLPLVWATVHCLYEDFNLDTTLSRGQLQKMFHRDPASDDGIQYATIGLSNVLDLSDLIRSCAHPAAAWSALYLTILPLVVLGMVDALNADAFAGSTLDVPPFTSVKNFLAYPDGVNPILAPKSSDKLCAFFLSNSIPPTHPCIIINTLGNSKGLKAAFNVSDDTVAYRWAHPHMMLHSSEQIVAELGGVASLSRNFMGGWVSRRWRPSFDDTDACVDAIAREIFGLETFIWNYNTFDWLLTAINITNTTHIHSEFQTWLPGLKSPDLIVIEHGLNNLSCGCFISAYRS
ncbi:hypothetical protein K488DRAFT_81741 [Vararia minispora EC-137]|uniref:Uncharacterized protein n=1 Tax=Vararia minispora EC-137 TaxID=1314806 RepID=A0ACB8QY27_9AGAM|nr:hypothetical protein K488DRAFT_81741 [Vararia minispora EC-137]